MTTLTNGQVRKSLASQIDRLDRVLDGLADGVNAAVAAAVREAVGDAVREAVEATLTQVLNNPRLISALHASAGEDEPSEPPDQTGPTPPRPTLRQRCRRACSWIGDRVRAAARGLSRAGKRTVQACQVGRQRVRDVAVKCLGRLWLLRPFAVPILIAVAVGASIGIAVYAAGPSMTATASGLGGFFAALLAQTTLWARRTLTFVPAVME